MAVKSMPGAAAVAKSSQFTSKILPMTARAASVPNGPLMMMAGSELCPRTITAPAMQRKTMAMITLKTVAVPKSMPSRLAMIPAVR